MEPGGLFSFGRLAPSLVIFPPGLDLFFGSTRGDSGLPFHGLLGLWLPDLPGIFLGFQPGYLEAVLESSFFCKGMGGGPGFGRSKLPWARYPFLSHWAVPATPASFSPFLGSLPSCRRQAPMVSNFRLQYSQV